MKNPESNDPCRAPCSSEKAASSPSSEPLSSTPPSSKSESSATNTFEETTTGDLHSIRTINSEDLLQGGHEVWIRHGNELYRLRRTSAGKLYLSK